MPCASSRHTPSEWADRGLVVLAGAGVSAAPPASVPSWWEFNQAVLSGLRQRFVSSSQVPARARRPLERLNLDVLDLGEFSQVVHNAFAGVTWFDLLSVLDGEVPNATHRTIASLARSGVLHAVVTTNFDTLFERSLPSDFKRCNALLDQTPTASAPALIKLHGTVDVPSSLVDLASQKRRGLKPEWRQWLQRVFATHCVLVLGFSGVDLELGEDYLGLEAASANTPWLAWNVRSGSAPHHRAAEVVASCGDRGLLLLGDLPEALTGLGVQVMAVPSPGGCAAARVEAAVENWLEEPQVEGDVCGVALTRLLDAAGSHSAARALRSALRTRTRRRLREGLHLTEAVRAALILGQVGRDDEDPRRAMKDLDLAERAFTAVVDELRRRDDELPPEGEVEYARNMSNLEHGRAVHYIQQGDAESAQAHVDRAWTHICKLPESEKEERLSAHFQNQGAIAWLNGDQRTARQLFERAHSVAVELGDLQFMKSTETTLRRLASSARVRDNF